MPTVAALPRTLELALPDLALARGGVVRSHRARGWWWSREGDTPDTLRPEIPTVLLVHALTGSAHDVSYSKRGALLLIVAAAGYHMSDRPTA